MIEELRFIKDFPIATILTASQLNLWGIEHNYMTDPEHIPPSKADEALLTQERNQLIARVNKSAPYLESGKFQIITLTKQKGGGTYQVISLLQQISKLVRAKPVKDNRISRNRTSDLGRMINLLDTSQLPVTTQTRLADFTPDVQALEAIQHNTNLSLGELYRAKLERILADIPNEEALKLLPPSVGPDDDDGDDGEGGAPFDFL